MTLSHSSVVNRLRRFADVDAGVVDENVDPAEFAHRALDHGGDGGFVGDVGDHGDSLSPALPEVGDRLLRLFFIAPDDSDGGARVRKPTRHAEADSAIAAGDDGHLAAQVEWI